MEIKICQNKEEWDNGLENGSFLQSWEWGEFQTNVDNVAVRLDVGGELVQGFEHKLPWLGKYLYIPKFQISNFKFQILVDYLKHKNYIFLRIEPLIKLSPISYLLSPIKNRQPQQTLILDLRKTEEELLAVMHSKTRYNIGLAERKGIVIKQEKNIDIFWELNKKTVARDKFRSHEKKYYEKMLELDICYQLTAYYENQPIASNIIIIFSNTATYLHGSSSNEYKNFMAPHLLQWEGIKMGKRLGCRYYDLWGVALLLQTENHPLAGVTRFKVGFGGEYRQYPQACDIILRPWYYRLYGLMRRIRGLKN